MHWKGLTLPSMPRPASSDLGFKTAQPTEQARRESLGNGAGPPHVFVAALAGAEEGELQLIGVLRILRSEALDLQRVLARIGNGATTPQDQQKYLRRTHQDLGQAIAWMERAFSKLPACVQIKDADTIRHIMDSWEEIKDNQLLQCPCAKIRPQDQMRYLDALNQSLERIVFYSTIKTIVARIEDWLEDSEPGSYLPFYEAFDDDLPKAESERRRILDMLSWSSSVRKLGYYVDASTGLIYRVDMDPAKRAASVWKLCRWFLGATLALLIISGAAAPNWPIFIGNAKPGGWLSLVDWPLVATIVVVWLALCGGVVFHAFIRRLKQAQNTARPPMMFAGGISLLANAKYGELLFKIGMALFGCIGYLLAVNPATANPATAFLLGYSLDSVVEIFSAVVERQSAAQVTALRMKIGM